MQVMLSPGSAAHRVRITSPDAAPFVVVFPDHPRFSVELLVFELISVGAVPDAATNRFDQIELGDACKGISNVDGVSLVAYARADESRVPAKLGLLFIGPAYSDTPVVLFTTCKPLKSKPLKWSPGPHVDPGSISTTGASEAGSPSITPSTIRFSMTCPRPGSNSS
jgi:hypothetical protein